MIGTKNKICVFAAAVFMLAASGFTGAAAYEPPYTVAAYAYKSLSGFDASLVTNVHYAFADIADGRISLDSDDIQNLTELSAIKTEYPKLKVILSVGGGNRSGNFSQTAQTAESRHIFAQSCLDAVNEYKLDGIDIDWEYPTNGNWGAIPSSPEDKQNFTLLLQEIRDALGDERIVSAAIGTYTGFYNDIDLETIGEIVDYIGLMNYDFQTSAMRHNANLYASDFLDSKPKCGDLAVQTCLENGIEASKILFGIPFYGKTSETALSYKRLKADYIDKNGYTRYWDDTARAAYLTNGADIITYEDKESIECKADYIKQNNLGGAMYWACANDDEEKTLTRAVFEGLTDISDKIEISDMGAEICIRAPLVQRGAVLAAALYDEKGLLNIKISSQEDNDGNVIAIKMGKNEKMDRIKAFLWDGLDTVRPLLDSAILEE